MTRPIRLVLWNIRLGGGGRFAGICDALARLDPDVVVLLEVSRGPGLRRFRDWFAGFGLRHGIDSFVQTSSRVLVGPRRYGILIMSRWKVSLGARTFPGLPWRERILHAVIEAPVDLILTSIYVPPGSAHGTIKTETLKALKRGLRRSTWLRHRVVLGDFNLPKKEHADGCVEYWDREGTDWHAAEHGAFEGMEEVGLRDAFRCRRGGVRAAARAYSWVQRRKRTTIRRRFDHAFVSERLRVRLCRYDMGALRRGLSDHAPMIVDLVPRSGGRHRVDSR